MLLIEGKYAAATITAIGAGLDRFAIRRLAVAAEVSEPTCRAWLIDPNSVRPSNRERLSRAAAKLRLAVHRKGSAR